MKEKLSLEVDYIDDSSKLPAGKWSPFIGALTTFNAVVGVGVLYLPKAFAQSGVVVSFILCALVAFVVYYTSCIVVKIGQRIGAWSYEEICLQILGRPGYYILAVSCVLFNWTACVTYLLSIHEMLTPALLQVIPGFDTWSALTPLGTWKDIVITIVLTMLIVLPLSLLKDLSALQHVSILKAVVMVGTMALIFITGGAKTVQDYQLFGNWTKPQVRAFMEELVDSKTFDVKTEVDTFWEAWEKEKNPVAADPAAEEEKQEDGTEPAEKQEDVPYPKLHYPWIAEKETADGDHHSTAVWDLYDKLPTAAYKKTFREILQRNNPNAQPRQEVLGFTDRMKKAVPYLFNTGGIGKIGTFVFSFVFHDSIFSVLKTIKQPNLRGWRALAKYAISFIFVGQVAFGIVIVFMFGRNIPSNFLTGKAEGLPIFPIGDKVTAIVRIAFSVVLLLTYPVCIVLSREYVESILILLSTPRKGDGQKEKVDLSGNGMRRHTSIIIALILVLSTLPWLLSPDAGETAGDIIDVFGALACGVMAFVLPSLCYMKVFGHLPCGQLAVIIAGVIIVVVCPILSILDLAKVNIGVLGGLSHQQVANMS